MQRRIPGVVNGKMMFLLEFRIQMKYGIGILPDFINGASC